MPKATREFPTTESGRESARERILHAAAELFYRRGVRNVGIDQIVAASGVAKMSLYKHFESKDALIEAWLARRDESWRRWFETRALAAGDEPERQLLGVFDALEEWFASADFRGCAFVNAAVEVADPGHRATALAVEHQRALLGFLRRLARDAGVARPEMLARQLLLLMEGAIVLAQIHGGGEPAREARRAARALIAAARQGGVADAGGRGAG
jgi:AcrR family transcriptional regulator